MHDDSKRYIKSGKQVANTVRPKFGKNDIRHWLAVVSKPTNGRRIESPHYSMRVQFKGERLSFSTGTSNKDQAARIARDIYLSLCSEGVEATVEKWRPKKTEPVESVPSGIATVGEFLLAAEAVSTAAPAT